MNTNYSPAKQYRRYSSAEHQTVSNAEALKQGLQECGVLSDEQVFELAMQRSDQIDQSLWQILARINDVQARASILRKKLDIANVSPIPAEEGPMVEFKAGIQAVPGSAYSRIANGGIKLIFSELAGFYNTQGVGSLFLGISDSRRPTALQEQLSLRYPSLYSRDRIEATLFYNIGRAWTSNAMNFLESLKYYWFLLDSHLVLRVDVKKTVADDIVLVNPHSWGLPIRCGSSLTILQGYDLTKWIQNKYNL